MVVAAAVVLLAGQPGSAAPVRDRSMTLLAGRLFPTLVALIPAAIADDDATATVLAARRRRMDACGEVPRCLIAAASWSAADSDLIARNAAHAIARDHLRSTVASDDGVEAEVAREIEGINGILKVYGEGMAARYPHIDGPIDAEGSLRFAANLSDAVKISEAGHDDPITALDRSIGLVLALLDTNSGDQAAAFEPLDVGLNRPALTRARTLDWSRYPFTSILVPGIGPDDLTTALSAKGKLNVRMAAARFADGIAPFIIVSGGAVHPRGTQFVEAIEMRRALIERFGISADCIVVEPYARHTTTNLRNVTRLLIALKAPLDRDALIVTNAEQSRYIESDEFAARNQRELGYQPGKTGRRLSATELSFRPSPESSRVDPTDPLDP
jgi:hypothetical protein